VGDRMLSAGDRAEEGVRDAGHLTL
jgi:hypothetical protein